MSRLFNSLYHPSYVPTSDWLKLQLLFWDSVNRIVPNSMASEFGDDYILKKFHIDPRLCPWISPQYEDLQYFYKHESAIQKAFENIRLDAGPEFESAEKFGVHPAKAPKWVFNSLIDLRLAERPRRKPHGYFNDHYLVHPEAGKLILSCLGSSIANRRGIKPITDSESSFYVTAANEINATLADHPNTSAEASLGILALKANVPLALDKLSFADILILREQYKNLREAFHKTVSEIARISNLNAIVERNTFEQELKACLESYNKENESFNSNKQKLKRLVTDWKTEAFTISLGAAGAYIAGGPIGAIIIGVGAAGFELSKLLFSDKNVSDKVKSFQYIQALNKYIDTKTSILGIRSLLMGVRY